MELGEVLGHTQQLAALGIFQGRFVAEVTNFINFFGLVVPAKKYRGFLFDIMMACGLHGDFSYIANAVLKSACFFCCELKLNYCKLK